MKVKESEKVGLKLNIQKTKIMASGPITSWEIDGKQWKLSDFIFLGSKITADGDCSHPGPRLAGPPQPSPSIPRRSVLPFIAIFCWEERGSELSQGLRGTGNSPCRRWWAGLCLDR